MTKVDSQDAVPCARPAGSVQRARGPGSIEEGRKGPGSLKMRANRVHAIKKGPSRELDASGARPRERLGPVSTNQTRTLERGLGLSYLRISQSRWPKTVTSSRATLNTSADVASACAGKLAIVFSASHAMRARFRLTFWARDSVSEL